MATLIVVCAILAGLGVLAPIVVRSLVRRANAWADAMIRSFGIGAWLDSQSAKRDGDLDSEVGPHGHESDRPRPQSPTPRSQSPMHTVSG
jgi:hypothetical protein